jgi:hypothetical protein
MRCESCGSDVEYGEIFECENCGEIGCVNCSCQYDEDCEEK